MKVAIIGSRNCFVQDLEPYLPDNVTEIISGGAKGIDQCAREYALKNDIKLTEYYPEYEKYARAAPLKRNLLIVEHADIIIAFWDGKSRGTKYTIEQGRKHGKKVIVHTIEAAD